MGLNSSYESINNHIICKLAKLMLLPLREERYKCVLLRQ